MGKPEVKGTWAVVTGASSGIGLEFSRQLAAMGCNLLMISNQEQELERYAAEISAEHGISTEVLCVNLAAADACATVMQSVAKLPDTPMILINDAGIFDFREVKALSPGRLDLYIDLHMRIVTHLTREMGELMAAKGRGYILNMSSMSCWMPMPGIAMYSATKAYIRAFSRAYRVEMIDRGVSVTVACPGGISTDLFGLPRNLQKLGVAVCALDTPKRFVRNALKRMLRSRPQYINGFINRLAIVAVGSLPEWGRRQVKKRILIPLSHDR